MTIHHEVKYLHGIKQVSKWMTTCISNKGQKTDSLYFDLFLQISCKYMFRDLPVYENKEKSFIDRHLTDRVYHPYTN